MYLYSLTLQQAGGISCVVYGNFSGTKEQEIVVARGKVLEMLRLDVASGKLQSVFSVEAFGEIRSLHAFKLTGSQKDYLSVGSDSGRIVILEYNRGKNSWEKIHQETYGKSGCRRVVPGQYLAVDPKGRAVMIAAVEKQKFVYVLNRDSAARLTISSPLEAHRSATLVLSLAALDCGFDNPLFAAIELDYADADQDPTGQAAADAQKQLTFFELDLGLNHVVRKWAEPVDNGANLLVPVPGGADGPSGVLVCAENFVLYKNQGQQEVRAVIPRRADLPAERGVLVVAAATHRQRGMFFFLLQVSSRWGRGRGSTGEGTGRRGTECSVAAVVHSVLSLLFSDGVWRHLPRHSGARQGQGSGRRRRRRRRWGWGGVGGGRGAGAAPALLRHHPGGHGAGSAASWIPLCRL